MPVRVKPPQAASDGEDWSGQFSDEELEEDEEGEEEDLGEGSSSSGGESSSGSSSSSDGENGENDEMDDAGAESEDSADEEDSEEEEEEEQEEEYDEEEADFDTDMAGVGALSRRKLTSTRLTSRQRAQAKSESKRKFRRVSGSGSGSASGEDIDDGGEAEEEEQEEEELWSIPTPASKRSQQLMDDESVARRRERTQQRKEQAVQQKRQEEADVIRRLLQGTAPQAKTGAAELAEQVQQASVRRFSAVRGPAVRTRTRCTPDGTLEHALEIVPAVGEQQQGQEIESAGIPQWLLPGRTLELPPKRIPPPCSAPGCTQQSNFACSSNNKRVCSLACYREVVGEAR